MLSLELDIAIIVHFYVESLTYPLRDLISIFAAPVELQVFNGVLKSFTIDSISRAITLEMVLDKHILDTTSRHYGFKK